MIEVDHEGDGLGRIWESSKPRAQGAPTTKPPGLVEAAPDDDTILEGPGSLASVVRCSDPYGTIRES